MQKYAIVTGCAKGIGREIAEELARFGYNIIGTYNKSINEMNSLKKKVDFIGVKFDMIKLDLLDDLSINSFLDYIKSKYKKIDILVNNAALSLDNELNNKTVLEFMNVLKVNLLGPFNLIKELRCLFNNSMIFNICSTDGIDTYSKYNIDYSASKAGLINLTKSLSLELTNAKIYAICPNWVDTESIREMNLDYLKEEMLRVGQSKLIDPKSIAFKIIDIIYGNYESGTIFVIGEGYE